MSYVQLCELKYQKLALLIYKCINNNKKNTGYLLRLPCSCELLTLLHKVYEPIVPLPKICLLSLKLHPYSSWVLMADGRTKGQLISEWKFDVFKSPKKSAKF